MKAQPYVFLDKQPITAANSAVVYLPVPRKRKEGSLPCQLIEVLLKSGYSKKELMRAAAIKRSVFFKILAGQSETLTNDSFRDLLKIYCREFLVNVNKSAIPNLPLVSRYN